MKNYSAFSIPPKPEIVYDFKFFRSKYPIFNSPTGYTNCARVYPIKYLKHVSFTLSVSNLTCPLIGTTKSKYLIYHNFPVLGYTKPL